MYSIASPEYFSMLYRVTKWHLFNAYKTCDLEYRNNILVILNLFASREEWLNLFIDSDIMDLLLHKLGDTENLYEHGGPRGRMTELDKEFYLLVWNCLKTLMKNKDCIYLIESSDYLRVLLHYIDLSSNSDIDKIYWSNEQQHTLCVNALNILQTVIPCLPNSFKKIMGIHVLFRNVRYYLSDRDNCSKEIEPSLKLCSIVSGLDEFKELFYQNDLISYFIELINDYQMTLKVKESICIILSNTCLPIYTNNHIIFREKNGIEILVELISHEQPTQEGGLRPLITALNALWVNVLGCDSCQEQLLDCEGIVSLLDLCEKSPLIIQHQIIGILADIMENQKLQKLFYVWKGTSTGYNVFQLLFQLWEGEETRLGILHPSDGSMRDVAHPLSNAVEFEKPNKDEKPPSKLEQAMAMSKYYKGQEDPYEIWNKKVCLMDLRVKIIALIKVLQLPDLHYIIDAFHLSPTAACNLLLAAKYI